MVLYFLLPVARPPLRTVCPWLQVTGPGPGPALQALASSTSSGSAGAPAPAGGGLQMAWGGGTFKQQSEFKYCFREVKDGQVRGLRSGHRQGPTSTNPGSLGLFKPRESLKSQCEITDYQTQSCDLSRGSLRCSRGEVEQHLLSKHQNSVTTT